MGFTFKENCPDTRNTKVADLVGELKDFVREVVIYDPHADPEQAMHEYGVAVTNDLPKGPFDVVVLAVKHDSIEKLGRKGLERLLEPKSGFVYDIKGVLPVAESEARL